MTPSPVAAIVGLGCATPHASATQPQALRFLLERAGLTGDSARFAEVIYRRSGVSRRASVLLASAGADDAPLDQTFFERRAAPGDLGPTTAARSRAYAALAPPLAADAARRALADAAAGLGDADPAAITHLVTVSCTGFAAPGVDHALIESLGLSPDVERLNIGFMGCHGGVVGLRAARSLALAAPVARPARVLLVCVELCSLHLQYTGRPDHIVANALFADGAAAAVVACIAGEHAHTPAAFEIRAAASRVFPDSRDAMTWTVGDHGFAMTLAESVPELIRAELGPWLLAWLASCGLDSDEARTQVRWAVHPGGPRILDAAGESLGLPAPALAASRAVLDHHGNMSSPTVLFILDRLPRAAAPGDARAPVVMVAFGPGLTAEALLLAPV